MEDHLQHDPCIEWTHYRTPDGYGQFRRKGKNMMAHRVAYCDANQLTLGDIKGKVVRHKCDNPACINPTHLELGTPSDNSKDMVLRGRSLPGEKHPKAKLTAEQVILIRSRYVKSCKKNGTPSLAEHFGVARQTIHDVISNRRWKCLLP